MIRIALMVLASLAALALLVLVGSWLYFGQIANPRVERELLVDPHGERAQRVMLLTLPSGRRIPVNYLHEGDRVFAAADGSWWKELRGEQPVSVMFRGRERKGLARAILDDAAYTERVFERLRPNAIKGFGTLVEIRLQQNELPSAPLR